MGLCDLHIHTIYSPDGTGTVGAILKRASEVGLNVIAITDHDEVRGALQALDLAPQYGIRVIPGSEISTAEGHLVGLFIHNKVPKGRPLVETIKRIADQGGLCFAAHPGRQNVNSLSADTIRKVLQDPKLARIMIGIEAFNASIFHLHENFGAMALARELPVARLGNSDAHLVRMIGVGASSFEGTSDYDLRRALENHATEPVISEPGPRLALMAQWGARLALRYAGWVSTNSHPQAPLRLARI